MGDDFLSALHGMLSYLPFCPHIDLGNLFCFISFTWKIWVEQKKIWKLRGEKVTIFSPTIIKFFFKFLKTMQVLLCSLNRDCLSRKIKERN